MISLLGVLGQGKLRVCGETFRTSPCGGEGSSVEDIRLRMSSWARTRLWGAAQAFCSRRCNAEIGYSMQGMRLQGFRV
jgi:hypothetical protein